ncbi:MAG TPA: alpha/beta hydrolase-fold protein [Streptosporangiaceae bacterium]|nr:alpha/beta hydrolase-fold protein [Streptosporangiaceae bacterium]
MLEPQSTVLFLLLMVVFCALLSWVALAKQVVFRVLAACLAFIPAMLFGVASVNKYYGYYQTWGAVAADFGGSGSAEATVTTVDATSGQSISAILGSRLNVRAAALHGQTVRLTVTGQASHLTRSVYVYLPPQYFRAAYRHYRFPAIELLPGFPGSPADWINVVGVTAAYGTLLATGVVKPAVLVMPDANGGRMTSLQCLNVAHGPADATFLAKDLTSYLAKLLRIQPPGPGWGIAGYSEGGYCAANLALIYRLRYGFAGVLSGYFTPLPKDQFGSPPRLADPFASRASRRTNSPQVRITRLPVSATIPQFWLGVGGKDAAGVHQARRFQRLVIARQPGVRLDIESGGGHTMVTWRALVPPMLEWMMPRLALAAQHPALARGSVLGAPVPSRTAR